MNNVKSMVNMKTINSNNYNDFRIIPERNNTPRQFILTRYGRSYNLHDTGNPRYLQLCESMGYVFNVDPGYYKLDIIDDSICIQLSSEEEFNRCTSSPEDS